MSRGIEAGPMLDGLPADLEADGADHAATLLARAAAGTSSPADFAAVVAFLHCHPMLCGFGAVILGALEVRGLAVRGPRR